MEKDRITYYWKEAYPKLYEGYKGSEIYRLRNSIQTHSNKIKAECKEAAGYVCAICGQHTQYCDAHHIIPLEQGGPDTLSNLICLCRGCHQRVHKGVYRIDPETKAIEATIPESWRQVPKPWYVEEYGKLKGLDMYYHGGWCYLLGLEEVFVPANDIKQAIGYTPECTRRVSRSPKAKLVRELETLGRQLKAAGDKSGWHRCCYFKKHLDEYVTYREGALSNGGD